MVDYLFDPPTDVTTATDMISWINSTTSMWLFQGIIGGVFIIILVTMLKNQANTVSKSVAASSFIVMLLSVFARTIDLIPTYFMSLWIILTGISAIWMFVEGVK